ncbi:MAG: exopolysaccharide biosynthesis protein [Acidobacteriota bacterium]
MKVEFHHEDKSVSSLLYEVSRSVHKDGLTLRELLEQLGERGLLVMSMVLTVPFLLPISIPGSSIPFGLIIALIGMGIITNKAPWLPNRLMNRRIAADKLILMLEKGAHLFSRIEKRIHPRLLLLTHGMTITRLNGILLVASALLLMAPLPIPLSNMPPAYGILFLALGSMERDGYFIIAGYVIVLATTLIFSLIGFLGVAGAENLLRSLWR